MAPGFWGFHTQIAGMGDAKGPPLERGEPGIWDMEPTMRYFFGDLKIGFLARFYGSFIGNDDAFCFFFLFAPGFFTETQT